MNYVKYQKYIRDIGRRNKAYSPFTYCFSIQNKEKRQNHKWENPPSKMNMNKNVWNLVFNISSQQDQISQVKT